jgi:ABC-type antimicrobial peptide transport system permease subunit
MALGATARDVSALVLADAGRMIGGGLAIGLVAAAATAPLLGRFLFGVSALDPLTLAIVCAVLGAVGVTAAYAPASRAARLAPLSVLRVE